MTAMQELVVPKSIPRTFAIDLIERAFELNPESSRRTR
jgi:hypothetical protein